ncbi:MAG: nucleotide sugar dehydrogenase [Pseudomonadota bacterium]
MTKRKIAVVGLGYVGLPVAVAFGKHDEVIGFDISVRRIAELKEGRDLTGEVNAEDIRSTKINFTSDPTSLKTADFIIVAVPTPIDDAKRPDLTPVIKASETVGRNLSRGAIVVYESTVYPGVTEDVCLPILERESGLKASIDFKVGYSPERINPGDREHTFTKIKKVVSGEDSASLDIIAAVYSSVVTAGVHRASSIKVAEAAKVIENTQRDLNLALMNELSVLFNKMGIDTREVLEAAGTKWNFLPFEPGLVGGHCIGVDPYYLTYKAEQIGYHPQVILAGRRINDSMGKYVAEQTVKHMIASGKTIKGSRVLVLGITFKEDIPDIRNTRVVDIIGELKEYGCDVHVYDPYADCQEVYEEYGLKLLANPSDCASYDGVVVAVKHRQFRELGIEGLKRLSGGSSVLADVKGIFCADEARAQGMTYWRL